MTEHRFDQAIALQADGDNQFVGRPHPAWANMVGPFGGITAATALQALLQHPQLLGAPVALTVNYAAPLADAPFRLTAVPVRTNRSTQHWTLAMTQVGADGGEETVLTATAVTAVRRETWGQLDQPMPSVAAPQAVERLVPFGIEWLQRYDMRPLRGSVPARWDGSGSDSLTQMWVRDEPARPLDFAALASLADVFYPRVWLRRATRVPAGTVSITTYFHADAAMLQRTGTGYLFAQAQAQAFHKGFFDQTAQLWNEAGELLASSHQIVYYKE
jgi:acyl-CoA thioesterase